MKNHEYLQFQILVENETQVCFRISAQKYRENKLTPVGNIFTDDENKIKIVSLEIPQWIPHYEQIHSDRNSSDIFCVRGGHIKEDNTFILVTQSEFERILRACEKYNSFMQKYEEVTTSKTENETRKD
jgi:hypothetical protein